MDIEDKHGNRVSVTEAHWRRWPQLADVFTPVADSSRPVAGTKKTTPVVEEPPTGDKEKEN